MKPPRDTEKEKYVLGSMLVSADVALDIVNTTSPQDFYEPAHQKIAEACWGVVQQGRGPTIVDLMQCADLTLLMELQGLVYSTSVAPEYARDISNMAICRRAMMALGEAIKAGENGNPKDIMDKAQEAIIAMASAQKQTGAVAFKAIMEEVMSIIEAAAQSKGLTGISTGFKAWDCLSGGWHPAELTIVAARPAMGKTSLLVQSLMDAALHNEPVGFFSLEMGRAQLGTRAVALTAGINGTKLSQGRLADADWEPITRTMSKLSDYPFYVDDAAGLTVHELRSRAMRMQREYGIKALGVDYLQLLSCPGAQGRADEVSRIARELKNISKDLQIPVIALAQLSRAVEGRDNADRRPNLSHLKESGGIEEAADQVAFIFREEYYNTETERKGLADIIIAKHRNGPTGEFTLGWQGQFYRFVNLDWRH